MEVQEYNVPGFILKAVQPFNSHALSTKNMNTDLLICLAQTGALDLNYDAPFLFCCSHEQNLMAWQPSGEDPV